MNSQIIHITKKEAKANNLPPIGFSVEIPDPSLSWIKFPEPNIYFMLTDTPGGTLEFMVRAHYEPTNDPPTLIKLIKSCFNEPCYEEFFIGKSSKLNLAGAQRHALSFFTGQEFRINWCAALIPSLEGKANGLIVIFGSHTGSDNTTNCSEDIVPPILKHIVQSFRLD